jgi:hypothetical protein
MHWILYHLNRESNKLVRQIPSAITTGVAGCVCARWLVPSHSRTSQSSTFFFFCHSLVWNKVQGGMGCMRVRSYRQPCVVLLLRDVADRIGFMPKHHWVLLHQKNIVRGTCRKKATPLYIQNPFSYLRCCLYIRVKARGGVIDWTQNLWLLVKTNNEDGDQMWSDLQW